MSDLKALIVVTVPDAKEHADDLRANFEEGADEALLNDIDTIEACGDMGNHVLIEVNLTPSSDVDYNDPMNREGIRADINHAYVVGTPCAFTNMYDHEVYVTPLPEYCDHRDARVHTDPHPSGEFAVEYELCEACNEMLTESETVPVEGEA